MNIKLRLLPLAMCRRLTWQRLMVWVSPQGFPELSPSLPSSSASSLLMFGQMFPPKPYLDLVALSFSLIKCTLIKSDINRRALNSVMCWMCGLGIHHPFVFPISLSVLASFWLSLPWFDWLMSLRDGGGGARVESEVKIGSMLSLSQPDVIENLIYWQQTKFGQHQRQSTKWKLTLCLL